MRKYLPTFGELVDRMSICQLKEVFISEDKEKYAQMIADIEHDLEHILKDHKDVDISKLIRAVIVLSQINLHIWHNEANARSGDPDGNQLMLTHGLNGIRMVATNKIQEILGGVTDKKKDCIAADPVDGWEISW